MGGLATNGDFPAPELLSFSPAHVASFTESHACVSVHQLALQTPATQNLCLSFDQNQCNWPSRAEAQAASPRSPRGDLSGTVRSMGLPLLGGAFTPLEGKPCEDLAPLTSVASTLVQV